MTIRKLLGNHILRGKIEVELEPGRGALSNLGDAEFIVIVRGLPGLVFLVVPVSR